MKANALVLGLSLALSVSAGQFYSGQAARAVIGQSSFSSHDAGINAVALTVSGSKLFAADPAGKLLTIDLSQIPNAAAEFSQAGTKCHVCGFAPISSAPQRVDPASAGIAVWGNSVAAIDTHRKQVLFWRDVTRTSAFLRPDVTISGINPVSVALDGRRLFIGDAALHSVLVWNALPLSDDQSPDAVLGTPASFARPDALASDGTNLYVSDTASHRIQVFSPADYQLKAEPVINSGTLAAGPLAGGTLISVSGIGLADQTFVANDDGSEPLPLKLGSVQVIFDGTPLPLISVAPNEIRAQLPYVGAELSAATLYVRTERGSGVTVSAPVWVALSPASPGLFAVEGVEPRPGIAFSPVAPISSESPAHPGDTIRLWATGLHVIGDSRPLAGVPFAAERISVAPITASVDGQLAEVVSVALPPTSIGVYEVALRLPRISYRRAEAQITISEDGVNSNTVSVPVAQ